MCRDLVNLKTADCRRKTQYPLQSYMDETAKEVCLLPHEKFRTEVYLRIIDQSINKNVYSASKSLLLRGTPNPGQAKMSSLQNLLKLRTS